MLRGGVFRGCTVEPVGDHERMRPADTTPPGHGSGERSDAATGRPTTPPIPADAPRRAVTDGPETWPTGRLLVAAGRRVMTAWDEAMTPLGLTHATLPVLVLLARSPHSQRDLAHAVDVREQTMSRTVAGLEHAGHVRRRPDPADGRRLVVELTASGRELVAGAGGITTGSFVEPPLTPAQHAALREALVTLLRQGPGPL